MVTRTMDILLPTVEVKEFRLACSWLGELSIGFFASLVNILPEGSESLPRVLLSMPWIESCVSKMLVAAKEQLMACVVLLLGGKSSLCINPEASVFACFVGISGAPLG